MGVKVNGAAAPDATGGGGGAPLLQKPPPKWVCVIGTERFCAHAVSMRLIVFATTCLCYCIAVCVCVVRIMAWLSLATDCIVAWFRCSTRPCFLQLMLC